MSESVWYARILVVDDQVTHLRALCDILGRHDFDTTGCSTGEAALAELKHHPFDLLLTDLVMPGIDGLSLVEAARKLDPEIACIIMTGEGTVDTAIKAMKIGVLDYIVKPFKAASLLPVLERAIESRRLRRQNAMLETALRARVEELGRLNTVLDAARKEAERANQEKSTFLSSMSHELRTPLNSILGFAQILASDKFPKGQGDTKHFAGNIVQAGRHLLTLVNEILDLAKIEAGKVALAVGPMALDAVLRDAYAIVGPLAQARRIRLAPLAETRLELSADQTRVKQILVNLLSNAVKYNREHGHVSVRCEQHNGYARIAVSDTGLGLTPEQLAAIFQPFSRAGREDSNQEGTGLGLTITQRLVVAMRGSIEVESQPGVGSTFRIELPLLDSAAIPTQAASATPAGADSTPCRTPS
ncbi:signal transduction histidine kinase [Duganella sp. SG902]|uniref:hybrid sensor histidine kinase/response regulator n=1 Tax=Duganella sp. SG902 TaxID=2587016 RepID=UPI00159D583F|nr:hybrid sensor histidine kinase/response regulator [Duganella sp. SG902]NVM78436.1 signal transduction histidine kinase [Duganella sp. SG902]